MALLWPAALVVGWSPKNAPAAGHAAPGLRCSELLQPSTNAGPAPPQPDRRPLSMTAGDEAPAEPSAAGPAPPGRRLQRTTTMLAYRKVGFAQWRSCLGLIAPAVQALPRRSHCSVCQLHANCGCVTHTPATATVPTSQEPLAVSQQHAAQEAQAAGARRLRSACVMPALPFRHAACASGADASCCFEFQPQLPCLSHSSALPPP